MQRLGAAPFLVGAALVVYPLIVPPFFAFQIGGQILILGMIGLSLMVLAGHGGLRHPIGSFLGALVYVLLKTFAIDLIGAERFNTLIGLVFLTIVFVSPDGIVGLWQRLKPHLAPKSLRLQ